jgi:hypothetical protein
MKIESPSILKQITQLNELVLELEKSEKEFDALTDARAEGKEVDEQEVDNAKTRVKTLIRDYNELLESMKLSKELSYILTYKLEYKDNLWVISRWTTQYGEIVCANSEERSFETRDEAFNYLRAVQEVVFRMESQSEPPYYFFREQRTLEDDIKKDLIKRVEQALKILKGE